MAWRVEDVEGAVAEKVVGAEVADQEGGGFSECDFAEFPISVGMCQEEIGYLRRPGIYLKSLSRTGESCFVGQPGAKASLNPGPTTTSVDGGKVDGSPKWSQCQ